MIAKTIDLLKTLIHFDTSSRNSNLALIYWIQDYLKSHNIESEILFSRDQKKANLFASIQNQHASKDAGILLSGHTDVVPVDGQTWKTDPFEMTQRDSKLFGRGSADMKGFIACCLAMIETWQTKSAQNLLKRPLYFAFSYDEEVGCLGVHSLIECIQKKELNLAGCIVGEPTNMQPVIAHKGLVAYRCRVHGHAAHSSLPEHGVSAVYYAAQLICYIYELAEFERHSGKKDFGFDVAYSTINVGTLQGGTALNIIAQDSEFVFDYRYLPDTDPNILIDKIKNHAQTLLLQMQKGSKEAYIEFDLLADVAGLADQDRSEFFQYLKNLTNSEQAGKVAYATEAGFFAQANITTIICGPGSINVAHQPDEYIEISELEKCLQFLEKI